MCLAIARAYHPELKPLVAKDDLIVAKCLLTSAGDDKLLSPYRLMDYGEEHAWTPGKLSPSVNLTVDLPNVLEVGDIVIFGYVEAGYHAYYSSEHYLYNIFNDNLPHLYLMRIPKGTKYFLGTFGDIVAEQMELVGNHAYYATELHGKLSNVLNN